jgi:hypothetical protein
VSATFTADALLAIGTNQNTTPAIRLLVLASERSDRAGLAIFEPGELQELLHGDDFHKSVEHVLHIATAIGYTLPDSTAEEVNLDLSLVQPEGFPEVGARYGLLVLVREVNSGRWLAKCACGSFRTYAIKYLETGLTTQCAGTSRHHRVTKATTN